MARISKAEKARVRQRLLDSAARHFAEKGLGGANINQISIDAGYGKGTVYNYFASKEELFGTVLAVGSEETIARYRARGVSGPTRDHLLAIAEEDVTLVREHEDVMKIFVRELVAPKPETRALVLEGIAPLAAEVATILARGQAAGEVRTDMDAPTLALAFLGQLTMGYVQTWTGMSPDWDALAPTVVTLFLDGATGRLTD